MRVFSFFLLFLSSFSVHALCSPASLSEPPKLSACIERAEQGDPVALWQLGLFYETEQAPQGNTKKAFRFFERSANLGNDVGQYHLGRFYDEGIVVKKSAFNAVNWYEKSAAQDNIDAINALGRLYFDGRGVQKNEERALSWFEISSQKGSALGKAYLGYALAFGRGIKTNYQQALAYLDEAVEKQEPAGWFFLGLVYLEGKGVAADKIRAGSLINQAARTGFEPAVRYLREKEEDRRRASAVNQQQPTPVAISPKHVPAKNQRPLQPKNSAGSFWPHIVIAMLLIAGMVFFLRKRQQGPAEMSDREVALLKQTADQFAKPAEKPAETAVPEIEPKAADHYDTALLDKVKKELEYNDLDKATWDAAMKQAMGDHARAELLYLKLRVKQLQN